MAIVGGNANGNVGGNVSGRMGAIVGGFVGGSVGGGAGAKVDGRIVGALVVVVIDCGHLSCWRVKSTVKQGVLGLDQTKPLTATVFEPSHGSSDKYDTVLGCRCQWGREKGMCVC